jgi:DMSO/TMAO reductase YedYZ heme-binding membrane subunit
MRTFMINLLGVIRYARPDRNPLRRRIDRVQTRLITALGVLFLILAPFAATTTAHVVGRAGVRAEHLQALTRHRADAVVLGASPSATASGFNGTTRVMWRDTTGAERTAAVPAGANDRAGTHRTIWIDRKGALTTHPRRHSQTVADTIMAALTVVIFLSLLHSVACTLIDRRLERRRLALWEQEWTTVAPRWTGRPRS